MNTNTKIDSSLRLLSIYLRFQRGEKVSTKELASNYDTTPRTILRDIEKINSFIDNKIVSNRTTNLWVLEDKNRSLLLSEEEQLTLNILDQASAEQGKKFHQDALKLFDKFKSSLHNTIYNNIDSEDISDIKIDLANVENAVYNKYKIKLKYLKKDRIVEPLKLANFEGYWYLVVNDLTNKRIKTFYFKEISNIEILEEQFDNTDILTEQKLKNALNAYFTPDVKPYEIQLFISKEKADIFRRKPLSKSQIISKEYDDGSFDFSIIITHDMEIIPKIQQFIPYLKIINDDEHGKRILNTIMKNMSLFKNDG